MHKTAFLTDEVRNLRRAIENLAKKHRKSTKQLPFTGIVQVQDGLQDLQLLDGAVEIFFYISVFLYIWFNSGKNNFIQGISPSLCRKPIKNSMELYSHMPSRALARGKGL
jgi:hypothetical protein